MPNQIGHDGTIQYHGEFFLARPRVDRLLEKALQKPLAIVVAGAGYGKTYAVSSALEFAQIRCAWLQLSEMDNTVAILWNRLACAIAVSVPELAKAMRALGHPDSSSFFQLYRLFEVSLRRKGRLTIVLDDFHSLQNHTGLTLFENLITAGIPNLSFVLITRKDPHLSLTKMLSRGLMARITEDDLRFTQDEMVDYFRLLGETPGAGLRSSLYAFTEGWIFAISLVGLSMRRRGVSRQNHIASAKVDIFALIQEEIYQNTSKAFRKSLAIFALLDDPPAELLQELATVAREILPATVHSHLLIRYDAHTRRYRMHRLFKDFLSEKKDLLTREEMESVHLTAARWYSDHHALEEAIGHYWKCERYFEVFEIILSARTHVARDIADLFITRIEQAPEEVIRERPLMRVVRAQYLLNNNKIQEARDALLLIRDEYETLLPSQERSAILGEVYILLSLISVVEQSFEFVDLFKKADQLLPSGSVLIDNRLNIAEGINFVGIKNPAPGELIRYQEALFEAAPYASRVMNGCGYGVEYLNATDVALMTGNLSRAEKYAYETVYRAQQQQQHGIELMANYYLIRIFIYKGNYAKIALLLEQMKEKTQRLQNADCLTLYDIIEGWLFVKMGRTHQVAKWILREEETMKVLAPLILGREYLVRSDSMLAEGSYYELLGFMKKTDVIYAQRGILYAQIQNRITESIIHHCLDNHRESMAALQSAYNASHQNHLIMQYIEYGSKMRAVAKAAIRDESCQIPLPWLENIMTKSSTYAKRLSHVTKDYMAANAKGQQSHVAMSKRETEILLCIAQGLTREEIADTHNLSLNTVKSIQKSILNKLGAVNSADAVRIATMLGLI